MTKKKNFAFLAICLFFVAIITSACGGGSKTTPADNSAFYYLLAQQNANNDQPPAPSPTPDPSPTPAPSPTSDPSQTPDPEPTLPTLEVSKSKLSLIVGGSEDITVTLEGNPLTDGLQYDVEDESVAKVENGKVTALGKGSTTVTVSLENGGANSATFTVENFGEGDYIPFGHYRQKPPQTGDGDDAETWEPQPIEWQILDIDTVNNRALLLSRYGLDAMCFDSSSKVWANSEIRSWLKEDFYTNAFDETEQAKIKPVDIVFNNNGTDNYDFAGSTYNVFLLSKAEAEKYFADDDARRCEPTAYAVNNGAYVEDGYSFWWLRSPYPDSDDFVYYVKYLGSIYGDLVYSDVYLVRPALWINL